MRDYVWSPSGRYLAFSSNNPNNARSIHIWSETGGPNGQLRQVTDEQFNAQNPAWDPDGNFLYFLSDRQFAPQISSFEFNYATNRTTGIFAMALRKDVKHPFPPESDEVGVATAATSRRTAPAKPPKRSPKPADAAAAKHAAEDLDSIDFDGLAQRVARVPVEADNYNGLAAKKGHLLYTDGSAFFYGRQGDRKTSLRLYSIKDRKETVLADDIQGYVLSERRLEGPRPNRSDLEPSRCDTCGRHVEEAGRPPPASWSTACPPRSGTRSSARSGVAIATGSTSRTCTASTGRPCASSTRPGCPTSPTAPTSTT